MSTYAGPPLPVNGAPALTQAIDYPSTVAAGGSGGFYVASLTQPRVYRVTREGVLILVAGSSYGFGGDGGRATSAKLASGLAVDSSGSRYIADRRNGRIRKVAPDGVT